MVTTSMIGLGSWRMARTKTSTMRPSNCALAQRSSSARASTAPRAFLVGAVAGDGVVGVGNRDDARAQRNLFAGQGVRVAGTIEIFVMVQNHFADMRASGVSGSRILAPNMTCDFMVSHSSGLSGPLLFRIFRECRLCRCREAPRRGESPRFLRRSCSMASAIRAA